MILEIAVRILHVLTAILLLGGSMYLRFILAPAAAELPEAEHEALRTRLRNRWNRVVMLGILLLLVTGFWNYLMYAAPAHQGANRGQYHMLMGIKILLALGVFFLASVLTGRSARFEPMRRAPLRWLTLLIVLAVAVVGIASTLKIAVPASVAAPAEANALSAP